MRIHHEDPKVVILDNIAEGRKLRRNFLQKAFNQPRKFDAAIDSSDAVKEIGAFGEDITDFLQQIFAEDDDEFSHSLTVQSTRGRFNPPEILWTKQYKDRDKRNLKFTPKIALHKFGMSAEFGKTVDILNIFGKYVLPITGANATLFITNRTIDQPETHIDGNGNVPAADYFAATLPIGLNQHSAILEKDNGTDGNLDEKNLIVPPDDSLIAIFAHRRHGTPASEKFRPILGAQPPSLRLF